MLGENLDEDQALLNAVDQAAVLCSLGLDGLRFLYTADPVDRILLGALARRVHGQQRKQREELATLIINRLSEAMR